MIYFCRHASPQLMRADRRYFPKRDLKTFNFLFMLMCSHTYTESGLGSSDV